MILVSGYYGYLNSGDEAILAALCSDFESLGIKRSDIIVLSGNPAITEELHMVKAISRYNLPKIISLLPKVRLMISGGGSLLQDSTSWRTIPYYLAIVELCVKFRVPVIMYAQGIGPVQSKFYKCWIKRAVNKMDKVLVRDTTSAELLSSWGVIKPEILVSADPVFGFNQEKYSLSNYKPGITFNLRPYKEWPNHYTKWCQLVRLWINEYDWPVFFVPLSPKDTEIGYQLLKEVPEMKLIEPRDWLDACKLMSRTKVALTMRLHGMIFASIGGTIPIGLTYDPKIASIGGQLQVPVRDGKPDASLTKALGDIMENFQHENQLLLKQVGYLKELALNNRRILADFYQANLGG